MFEYVVKEQEDELRLDRLLRKRLPRAPLSHIYKLIRKKEISVNGRYRKGSYRLNKGEKIEGKSSLKRFIESESGSFKVDPGLVNTSKFKDKFKLVFEDENLLVCDKPAGLVVHPGTGHMRNDTLLDFSASYLFSRTKGINKDEFIPPYLVHRLDRDTSGVILIAKKRSILRDLHKDFKKRNVTKIYTAICHNRPAKKRGEIKTGLLKTSAPNEGAKVHISSSGSSSHSSYKLHKVCGAVSKIEIVLHTGRMHQIRAHMAYIGCPVLGDVRYGDREADSKFFKEKRFERRLYLHSGFIRFYYPPLQRELAFSSPLPESFELISNGSKG